MASSSQAKISSGASAFFPVDSQVGSDFVKSQTIEQTMERLPNGTRRLAAQLRTTAQLNAIWKVLTNYNLLSDCIPNLSVSEVLAREANTIKLRQVGTQKLIGLNFSAEVFLELKEDRSNGLLSFRLLKGDFRRFEGAWTMKELSNGLGTCLLYELTVQGCIGMPVSLIEKRLKRDLSANLLAVEKTAKDMKSF